MIAFKNNQYEPKMYKHMMLHGYNTKHSSNIKDRDAAFGLLSSRLSSAHAFNLSSVFNIIDHSPWNTTNMLPPFPVFWLEYSASCWGILVIAELEGDVYSFYTTIFSLEKGVSYGPIFCVDFQVTSDGKTIQNNDGTILFRMRDFNKLEERGILHGKSATTYKIVANFLGLINAKNVSCPSREFEVNNYNKRILKTKKANRYHVLKIHKPGEKIRKDSETGENEGKMPLHVVRGHLADYTENGLFGKYFGTYFIPSHVRGKVENGTVTKDYALV